jgi:hypothetical protein
MERKLSGISGKNKYPETSSTVGQGRVLEQ